MREFKELETCMKSSAKASPKIRETFCLAQNAALHPRAPLYDPRKHANSVINLCLLKLCDVIRITYLTTKNYTRFNHITCEGFLYLDTCVIQSGRLGIVWCVLRVFGYGDDLTVSETFLPHGFTENLTCTSFQLYLFRTFFGKIQYSKRMFSQT
ncbi:uncharacterized protein MELLADRAFT_96038 [Melampsora larici-populina 98AG31]|uniref:EF hand associated type-2 domain-containing protein n=1 Tax=Melampsora larici-populina (strain 98AG31 / pathotype 3-4-7) TaxID=747676 RepID=F4SAP1_MELLP|nr:uncharacterized protein MELLADRAFT_96038 [Melampsora larici-populina 98AG31]EGF98303.1 hypothetical protein MELLADRAFT_96038 [Melampsora larici-populina 98AG31]